MLAASVCFNRCAQDMAIKQIALAGERVVLRPWQDRDADAFALMNADERVMEFFVAPLSRRESDALLPQRAVIQEQGWGWWCVDINGDAPALPA